MNRTEQRYTPLFCEENVWHLARRMLEAGEAAGSSWVLLFSNPERQMVMLHQRRAGPEGYVVWDYHLVLQVKDLIYDLDTNLPFPMPAFDYLHASFPDPASVPEIYRGLLRRIPAESFVERFHSDRSHMEGVIAAEDFPSWPAILPDHDASIPLRHYWDLARSLPDGSEVMSVLDYQRRLA